MHGAQIKLEYPSRHATATLKAIKFMTEVEDISFDHKLNDESNELIITAKEAEDIWWLGIHTLTFLRRMQ